MVNSQLLVAFAKTREHHAMLFRHAVAVVVFQKPNIRSSRNEQSAVERKRGIRKRKIVGENGRALVLAVLVFVRKPAHRAAHGTHRVIAHFNDVHAPIFVPGNRNRIDDVRLARNAFDCQ